MAIAVEVGPSESLLLCPAGQQPELTGLFHQPFERTVGVKVLGECLAEVERLGVAGFGRGCGDGDTSGPAASDRAKRVEHHNECGSAGHLRSIGSASWRVERARARTRATEAFEDLKPTKRPR